MTHLMRNMILLSGLVITLLLISCAGTAEVYPAQEDQSRVNQMESDSLAVQIQKKTAELKAAQRRVKHISNELQALMEYASITEQQQLVSRFSEMNVGERAQHLINFKAQQTDRGLVLRFLDVGFDLGKASLTSNAERSINELVEFLNDYPELTILIEGHTDNTGSNSLNKRLSQQRANFVSEALISRGIDRARMQAVGLGEQFPLVTNATSAGRQQNRRVVVVISEKSGQVEARD